MLQPSVRLSCICSATLSGITAITLATAEAVAQGTTARDARYSALVHDPVGFTSSLPASSRTWVIDAGTYAGAAVEIRADLATLRKRGVGRFWRIGRAESRTPQLVGWRSTAFPIPLAFRHEDRSDAISEADSALFWRAADQLEQDLGRDLFTPATIPPYEDPPGVIVVDLRSLGGTDAVTYVTWSAWAEVYDARISFRDRNALTHAGIVTHELMHALGFGHSTGWASVMRPSGASAQGRLTLQDVAHAQFAFRVRAATEKSVVLEEAVTASARELPRTCRAGIWAAAMTESETGEPLVESSPVTAGREESDRITAAAEYKSFLCSASATTRRAAGNTPPSPAH